MQELIRRVTLNRNRNYVKSDLRSGDTAEVAIRVKEGEKERIQVFKGTVIKVQGSGMGKSFTVRKISESIGVERTFPYSSPAIESVKLIARGSVRRSRLYYLRKLAGKAARISSERIAGAKVETTANAPEKSEETEKAE